MSHPLFIPEEQGIKSIYSFALKCAKARLPLQITGETGTGKSSLVTYLHQQLIKEKQLSPQAPLVRVDCGNIIESLFESELFGSRKGAFSDAEDRKGKLELADGGILFLDEIGNLPLDIQKKFLTALEEKTFTPVGSNQEVKVNFLLITATNINLAEAEKNHKFRADLNYRIKGVEIKMPSLREAPDLIASFADYFITKFKKEYQSDFYPSQKHISTITNYTWPGNIRELANEVRTMIALGDDFFDYNKKWNDQINTLTEKGATVGKTFEEKVNGYEKELIVNAIKTTHGNVKKAAEKLEIPRANLIRKIGKLNINTEQYK